MLRSSRLVPLLTLLVGGLGGWAAASGGLDTMLRAEPQPAEPSATRPTEGGRSADVEKTAPRAAVDDHNAKVAADLRRDGKKPNIVFIMGDDVGWFNIAAYHRGIMSGKTPNLDKLASQGMLFTDY